MPIEGGLAVGPKGLHLYFRKDITALEPCQWVLTKRLGRREYWIHGDQDGNPEIKAVERPPHESGT